MLNIGVIGAGHLGKIHIKIILELNEKFNLIGFYDTNEENAKKVASEFGIRRFDSMENLILAVDCLDIVTPTITHYECASKAIRHSKHVFIEKPVTETLEEAKSMLNLSREADVKVQVGHVERFNPAFVEARKFLKQPMFIETHRLAQFNPRGMDVPVVLDLMIHDLDIILSIVKSNVKNVSASGVSVISNTSDITNARIEFDNGCVANLTASRISMKNMRKSRFFQKDAYISVDFLSKEAEIVRMQDINGAVDPFDIVFDIGNGKPSKKILFDKPEIFETNAIKEEFLDFYRAITQNEEPIVSLESGYKALQLAHQIIERIDQTVGYKL